MENYYIHIRHGLTSRILDITGWKVGEWIEVGDGTTDKKRLIIRPDGTSYQDFLREDGKHDLVKIEEKNKTKKVQEENKELKEAITEKEISLEERESEELKLYKYIIALDIRFCTDQFSNEVAIYKNKYYVINGKEFKSLVAEIYFEEKGKVFNDGIWKKVLTVLNAKCSHKIEFFPLRAHTQEGKNYYDDGQLVWEFDNGEYKTYDRDSKECPVIFRRYNHQLPAEIKPNDKKTKELLADIKGLFNIEDFREESIVPMFSSEHPEPMKLLVGDPGAAKSTLSLIIKRLVDPDQVERVSIPDKNNLSDFSMHRQHFYVILYDNIREFTKEQSDQLCMMITGGTGVSRMLYTNGDLHISKGLPRIIGNGLRPEPSNFNDLLDRTLIVDMLRIENSRPEKEIWSKVNSILPELRFCCLRDISKAVHVTLEEEQEFPRMSEYCLLGEKTRVLWKEENSFTKWFSYRMDVSHATGMDDPMMIVLEKYLESYKYLLETPEGIKMTGSDWRIKLVEWSKERMNLGVGIDGSTKEGNYLRKDMALLVEEKDFPKNATWMGRRFRDLSPLLRAKGYGVEVIRTADDRSIRLFIKK